MKFAGICLVTKNVTLLAEFYASVLGVEAEGDETHVVLHTEGGGITLFSEEGMESLAPNSMQGAGCGSMIIGFEVIDVDEEYQRLKTLDVVFVKLPVTHPWGTRSLWFRDPDGNIVNFFRELPVEI
jgi:catechol 2,3-dioxygenase-like lactoylglutathione lyase family enzyme